jgi:hypothetical protein
MSGRQYDFSKDYVNLLYYGMTHNNLQLLESAPQRFLTLRSSMGAPTLEKMLIYGWTDRKKTPRGFVPGRRTIEDKSKPIGPAYWNPEVTIYSSKTIYVAQPVKYLYVITALGKEVLNILNHFNPEGDCRVCRLRLECVISESHCLRERWYVKVPFKASPHWIKYFRDIKW